MTRLTEQQLSSALKGAVPEPGVAIDRAGSARTRAHRMRTRRRLATAGAAAAVAIAVAVPVSVVSSGTGSDPEPPGSVGTPSTGWSVYVPLGACATSGCDPARVRAAIERPLRLPTVSAGERCPVSPTRTFPGGAGFQGTFTGLGKGPVYLTPFGGPRPLRLTSEPGGWESQKVIWVIGRGYGGPLLLRGARIDASGKLGFAHYIGAAGYPGSGAGDGKPHVRLLYVRSGLDAPNLRVLDSFPSGIYAKTSGCYAIQVDGTNFSETLLFRAVTGPPR